MKTILLLTSNYHADSNFAKLSDQYFHLEMEELLIYLAENDTKVTKEVAVWY
jgi:hypothetical protein